MPGGSIRELFATLGFEVDDKNLKAFDKSLANAKSSMTHFGAIALGTTTALFGLEGMFHGIEGALSGIVEGTVKQGTEFGKLAERVGMSAEALQRFGHAANLADIDQENFAMGMTRLTRMQGEAKNGSAEAQKAFQSIGKYIGKDLLKSGKSAEEQLLDMADAFAKMPDQATRLAAAQDVFGRDGYRMVNMLKQGSAAIREQMEEADALGLVIGEEGVRATLEYEDSQKRLGAAIKGVRNSIGVELLPEITEGVNGFRQWIVANREWLKTNIVGGLRTLLRYLEIGGRILKQVVVSARGVVQIFGGFENVLKMVTYAMLAMLAVNIVWFFGSAVLAIGSAIKAFELFGNAGLIANAKAAAIPLLIGAAFIALGLIIEDIIAYIQGRDSVTGVLLDKMEKDSPRLYAITRTVVSFFKDIYDAIHFVCTTGSDEWDEMVSEMSESESLMDRLIAGAMAWRNPGKFLGAAWDNMVNDPTMKMDHPERAATAPRTLAPDSTWGDKWQALMDWKPVREQMPNFFGAPTPPASGPAQSISVTSPISVVVPPGTPTESVGPVVRDGLKDALGDLLRETNRATSPAVAY